MVLPCDEFTMILMSLPPPPPPPPPRTNLLKLNHVGFFTIPVFRSHLSDISNDQGSMLADLTLVTRIINCQFLNASSPLAKPLENRDMCGQ